MKNLAIILTSLIPFLFSFTASDTSQLSNCEAPVNVQVGMQTTASVTYNWDDCKCFNASYHVYYVKNGVMSQEQVTESSEFTFTNLSGGHYRFYFYTSCEGEGNSFIVEEVLDI